MGFASFHEDGLGGCRRTIVLALAAADALVLVDRGNAVDHLDGAGGAVTRTKAAADAVVLQHHSVADTDGRLLLLADVLDGARGAEFAAAGAGYTAEALVEDHRGLHKTIESRAGSQHMLGAFADAKLAGGTAALEVLQADGSGRFQRCLAFGYRLILDEGKARSDFLFLRVEHRGSTHSSGDRKELSPRRVYLSALISPSIPDTQRDGPLLAMAEAVETHHTARPVDLSAIDINAVGLAMLLALMTSPTLLFVDADAEERMLTEKAQQRPHRTDGVAPEATVEETHDEDDHQGDDSHDER